MQWLYHMILGQYVLVLRGADTEGLLNACTEAGLVFWGVQQVEDYTLSLCIAYASYPALLRLVRRQQCVVIEADAQGVPPFLWRFRRRYLLWLGAVCCVFSLCLLSRTILLIDIQGNEQVSEHAILSALRAEGVSLGVYGGKIQGQGLRFAMLERLPDLAYFALNLHGTRAEVIVRERLPKPELRNTEDPAHLVAEVSGIITKVEVWAGEARCQVGDVVSEGDCLISGLVEMPAAPYTDLGTVAEWRGRAEGRVEARTWRTLTARIPRFYGQKIPTGEEKSRFALSLLGKRMKFYGNGGISFAEYDKIRYTKLDSLCPVSTLPLVWEHTNLQAYTQMPQALTEADAHTYLTASVDRQLLQMLGEEGKVLQKDVVFTKHEGYFELTLLAECQEQIGRCVPLAYLSLPPVETEEGNT